MLRSVYLKTLRDARVPVMAWGLGLGALAATALYAGWLQSTTPEAQAALVALAPAFAWWADPVAITTPGGYVAWRIGPFIAIFPALWALLFGSQIIRGEEQQGRLEMLLAQPYSRVRLLSEKILGLATALLIMSALIALGIIVGGLAIQMPFPVTDVGLEALDVAAHAAVFGALALLLGQLTRERGTAAGIAGALLGVSFLLDSVARTAPDFARLRQFSTIYYFNLGKPLVPGYGVDARGVLALFELAAAFAIVAGWLFVRRDVGATAWRLQPSPAFATAGPAQLPPGRPSSWPSQSLWLRSIYARTLQQAGWATFWWGVSIASVVAVMTSLTTRVQENLADLYNSSAMTAALAARLSGGNVSSNAGYLSLVLSMLPILFAAFAVTQVSRWASSEPDGRLELLLAAPVERSAAMTSAFGAFTTALLVLGVFTLAGLGVTAELADLGLLWDQVVAAAFGMVPAALLIGALGFLLAAWLRAGAAVGVLTVLLLISLMLGYLGPALGWPDSVLQWSLLQQYGRPLLTGPDWPTMARLLVLNAVALGLASFRFARKDIR